MDKFILFLWGRRKSILIISSVIFVWAVVDAFLLTKVEYKATTTFFPPPGGSASISYMGIALPSMASAEIQNEQIDVIFKSTAIKRRIIDQFNFYDLFKIKQGKKGSFDLVLKRLPKYVKMENMEKGSMGFEKIVSYEISCFHPSPDSAKMLCEFAFSLLDSSVKDISMNRAHRNRLFVEEQLDKNKKILDSTQKAYTDFQIANKAFLVPEQIKMSLKTYADVKSAAILNDLKMSALQHEFSGDLPELDELKKNSDLYNQKLSEIEAATSPGVVPSLGFSAKLLPLYLKLSRETEVENQVVLLLSREREQARLQEAKNISSLLVVDPPYVPTYKARPKRIIVFGTTLFSLNLVLFIFLGYRFYFANVVMKNDKFRSMIQAIKSSKR